MPFIPHTDDDIRAMLDAIGADSIDTLFDEIPEALRAGRLERVPEGAGEMAVGRLMRERASADGRYLNFIGAGAYEHHIPAAVWQVVGRGEFYSAYTPYQAEASQGSLQLMYEYQSMMASLTGLDVSNASLYDGASALAEAVLMAVRAHKSSRRVLTASTVSPAYRRAVMASVRHQGIELTDLPYCPTTGVTPLSALQAYENDPPAALIVPLPNFFGRLEDVDPLTDWAHAHGSRLIAVVNPTAMALFKPPGRWGGRGADIAVGEGQPLGAPLSSGGPYFGFLCCKENLMRQMPGRVVGRTTDLEGRPGFALTLQAREQHIRRSKATSNICTNQGLVVTAATLYMALLGPQGLRQVALQSHANAVALKNKLLAVEGAEAVFEGPGFHEFVLRLSSPVSDVLRALSANGILGGHALREDYPELGEAMVVCATETKTQADLEAYATQLERVLGRRREAPPCVYKV